MQIALVQFEKAGKRYFFELNNNDINVDDIVVVETVLGLEIGKVVQLKEEKDIKVFKALKPIIRKASVEDLNQMKQNDEDALEALFKTDELINELKLDMKALKSEFTLDRSRLIIYFKAENRVDFRELVRELSASYHTRIELRQIGPRDVAKMVGGLGPCGRVLCCETFIGEFEPVTITMAKNQELSLNPANISGICGRLLCCLKYEDSVYEEMKELMPDLFEIVHTKKGLGKVIDINFIKSQVKIEYKNEEFSNEWLDYKTLDNR